MSSAKLWKTKIPKVAQFLLVFMLTIGWIFSGFPRIFNFPPGIQIASAAIPGYRSSGTFTAGTGAITPPYPADMAANDVCLLAVSSENQAITLTTANGFVEVPTWSPQGAGTAATDPASMLALYWKRTVGGDSAPVVADSINNTEGQIHCFSGVITSGDPWTIGAGGNDSAANDTTGVIPGATTATDDALVALFISTSRNANSTTECSGWTNTDLANLTERTDNSSTQGLGGGHCMATGDKALQGTYGNTTITMANTTYKGAISLALKPAPSTVTVGTTGTQTSSMLIPSTTQYVGGAFTLVRNEGSANVTAITITENGTVDALNNLDNIKLQYDLDITSPYDCVSESYAAGDTQYGSTDIDGFSAANGTSAFSGSVSVSATQAMCVYTVLDVGSGASNGDTLEIEITDPSTQVIVSAGVVSPATAVAISGATTINLAPAVRQDHFRWRNDNGPQGDTSQTLYFNPTGNGFAMNFTIVGGCTAGSEWDCVDDGTADTQSTAPTSDLETSQLKSVNGKSYYTLVNDALPAGATVTQLDITASGVDDVGNPNTSLTLGYCTTCDGATDVMGSAQAVTGADQTKTQQFVSLSLSTTDMNNMQLVVQGSGVNAEISTLYVLVTYTVSAATWRQAEDIVETGLAKSTNIRLRFQIDNTGGSASAYNYRLEWAAQSGTCDTAYTGESYAAVPDVPTTQHFDMTLSGSSLFVDGDPTTAQLSNAEAFTFVAGDQVESTSNQSGAITLAQNQYTEVEYVFQANTNATDGGVYCFRVTNAGTILDSADVIAQVTLAGGAASLTFVVSTDTFPTLTPGIPIFATTTLSVNTDNSTGWNVTVSRDDTDTTMDLDSDATVNIIDQTAWVPGGATTTVGNAVRISSLDSTGDVLAMRVMTASGTASFISTAWWGTTDAYIDSATTLWAGFNSTAQKVGDSSVSCSGADCALNTVLYYLDVPSTQKTGTYSGGITYTATMNP